MANKLTTEATISIYTSPDKVWQALTDPAMIKEYLYGTETVTDWKKGSSITYTGVWEGKPYEDKGTIVDIVPETFLHTTYFSPISGKEDKPENYANVIYQLKPENGHTLVTVTQDNIADEKQQKHMEQNWNMVLQGMKKLLEK